MIPPLFSSWQATSCGRRTVPTLWKTFEPADTAVGVHFEQWKDSSNAQAKAPRTGKKANNAALKQSGLGAARLESARQLAAYQAVIQLAQCPLKTGH